MYEPRRSRRIEEGYPFTYTTEARHSLISPFAKKIGVIFVAATLILMITISTRGSEVTQKHQPSNFGLTTESVSADLGANILGVKDKGRIDKFGPNPEDKAKEKDGGVYVPNNFEDEDEEEEEVEFDEGYSNKNGEEEYDDLEEDELDEVAGDEEEDELNDGEFDEDDLEEALDGGEVDLEDEDDLDEMLGEEEPFADEDGDDIEEGDEEEEFYEEGEDAEEAEEGEEEEEEGDKEAQEGFEEEDEEAFDEGDEEGGDEEEEFEEEALGGEDEEEEFEEEGGVFDEEEDDQQIDENDENDDVIEYSPLLILPLGDSITSGCCTEEFVGYRADLEILLKDSGEWEEYKIEYVGSQKDKAGNYHEGHPSTLTYNFLSKLEYEWLQEYIPDIVLINLGTQDLIDLKQKELDFDDVASNVTESIGEIIQGLIEINPGVSIVLCEIPPTNPNPQSFLLNEKIQQFLGTEFADLDNLKPDASITYMTLDVPSDWSTKYVQKDGVIPNHEGEKWIAAKYYEHLVKIILPEFETAQ